MSHHKPSPDADFRLESDGRFVIRRYNNKRPFSNFLPGIAGVYGTPMWVFYVNRGQGVASFGTKNKDGAILEFFPANKAYQETTRLGFRTFVKTQAGTYEPFLEPSSSSAGIEQEMVVDAHEFSVRETNKALGLEFQARYFTIPGEPIAALARELTVTNLSPRAVELEVLDGLPQVCPFGMNEFFVKQMSRTIEAWMVAENLEKKAAFYRLRVDATDRPEVEIIEAGNFFFALTGEGGAKAKPLDPVVDPEAVFGSRTDFSYPKEFAAESPFRPRDQVAENKTPCAFAAATFRLTGGQSRRILSFYGHARDIGSLNRFAERARRGGYFDAKSRENASSIAAVKDRAFTVSGSETYDRYCGQTFLDNVLRGGLPLYFGGKSGGHSFHVYSRKHGDLERDYNRFLVEPTYFSQGDGNYRDVNQNRRSDVWFEPRVRDTNVRTFLNFLQLDGFNPLVIKGSVFTLKGRPDAKKLIEARFGRKRAEEVARFLAKPWSPGELYRFLDAAKLATPSSFAKMLDELAPHLAKHDRAEHGEGFWVDHWTYNLDLIESYLAIYPEDRDAMLFSRREYTFHDDDHYVRPRAEKYFEKKPGEVRQYKSVAQDKEKAALIAARLSEPNVVRTRSGRGEVYRTTLAVKLLCLLANKITSLDPAGLGIEMEADKPSWYDALNGLPGLLGSSLCETYELKRLAVFLVHALEEAPADIEIRLPVEIFDFIVKVRGLLDRALASKESGRDRRFWDEAAAAKEKFRSAVFFGLSGKERSIPVVEAKLFAEHAREKVDLGLEKVAAMGALTPTYFENRVTRYSIEGKGDARRAKPSDFESRALAPFLEGPVHALKVEKHPDRRRQILKAVRSSGLFDSKLGMYKVNASLSRESLEIGRARVFAPGWLENESIWLHMEYKFLLELLKAGMADEFIEDFRRALVPFQPPARYGRSVLENSSFISSTMFRDPKVHGGGFVARLSGSTAEFLSMWLIMNVGKTPFLLGPDGKLFLRFQPTLPASLFTAADTERSYTAPDGEERRIRVPKHSYAFLFLGKTLVTYRNPRGLDTFGKQRVTPKKITLRTARGPVEFKGDTVPDPYAARVRDERIERIDVELG